MATHDELVEAVKFPFTARAKEIAEEAGFSFDNPNEVVLETAKMRVLSAVKPSVRFRLGESVSETGLVVELLSFPVAKIFVSLAHDYTLSKKFAQSESDRLRRNLQLSGDPSLYKKLAAEIGIKLVNGKVRFTDYLRALPNKKLVNTDMDGGFIPVDDALLVELIANTFKSRILSEHSKPTKLPKIFQIYTKEIKDEINVVSYEQDFGSLNVDAFPPCIKALIAEARSGKDMPHQNRFVLSTFLVNVGMPTEQIVKVFSATPNFNQKKTRYYVEYSAGKKGSNVKYTPPSCKKMQYYGLCRNKDSLCQRVGHPLSYYAMKKKSSGGVR
ncbi:MAG: hypothetical protein J7L23_05385 [Candidatus Diapherotrites archaeon]|nr:hypothetical protein [Candidatus Diapherotrites archaeon]